MVKFTLPKELRLLKTASFDFVFQKPKQVSTLQITFFGRMNKLGHPRIGFIIAKKQVRRSHDRNRIRRLIRESFRLHQHQLLSMDFVVLAKKGAVELNNIVLAKMLEKLWNRYCR